MSASRVTRRLARGESWVPGRRTALAWALALVASACAKGPAQLVVVVDTDARVPAEIGFVRARVLDAAGSEVSVAEATLVEGKPEPPARLNIPFSFAVVPVDGDASRRVTVVVEAYDRPGGVLRVQRRAETGFLPRRALALELFLARACFETWTTCAEQETCTERGCQPAAVAPESLSPVDPGREVSGRDAGVRDTGRDAGGDSGTIDATATTEDSGVDAGRPELADAGELADAAVPDSGGLDPLCTPDAEGLCTACPMACPATCGERGACCEARCPGGVCPACGEGCSCDARCTGSCDLDCEADATCRLTVPEGERARLRCAAGASCTLSCGEVETCRLDCEAGARCLLSSCSEERCEFTCPGATTSCPGNVVVCNRPCP